MNCPEDVKTCSAICWNGKIEDGEDCENCKKDVRMCISSTCGDGKIDKEAWEECDNGDKNGKDGKCTKMCTKYDANQPNCWNGKIDAWENCDTCPVDLRGKCVIWWEWTWDNKLCWNGKIDVWENCDPADLTEKNRWKYGCSNSCKPLVSDNVLCNPNYDWEFLLNLSGSDILCLKWKLSKFSFNPNNLRWTRFCVNGNVSLWCLAYKTVCGDWIIGKWEDCQTCPEDLKDVCITGWEKQCWDGEIDKWEDCKTCPEDIGTPCIDDGKKKCWNKIIDEWEDCKTCPEDIGTPCIDDGKKKCWNKIIDEWEDCKTCPEDLKEKCIEPATLNEPEVIWPVVPKVTIVDLWHVENDNCNSCPCEYVDFFSDFMKWDNVRAKLWDKKLSVFYRYSNSVPVERFIGIK